MPTVLPPARSDISNTPSPSNAVAKVGLGKLWDWLTNLFGTTGTTAGALTTLGAVAKAGDTLTGALNEAHGADITSAATINLTTATGNLVDVTGTNPISAVTLADGAERTVRFTGILQLTNGASFILPGGANIITAAGDFAVLRGYAAGVVRCMTYTRANGTPVATWLQSAIRSQLAGLTLSTAGSSATMSIASGGATDSTNAQFMALAAAIDKTTAAWAVGNAVGGLDTGAIAINTWYHFYLIKRLDTGVVDVVFSLSASAPTLPASYTLYRRIGSGRTNGSAQWTAFIQDGDYYQWSSAPADISAANPGIAAVSRTLSVPTGVNVIAHVQFTSTNSALGGNLFQLLSDLATTDLAPSATRTDTSIAANGASAVIYAAATKLVRTNTSGQIRSRQSYSDASTSIDINTLGWFDRRGRDA